MQARSVSAFGYVKVELRSRSPRLWGWNVHRAGSDNVVKGSEAAYGCAEDAWKAGQAALAKVEAALPPAYLRAFEQDFAV